MGMKRTGNKEDKKFVQDIFGKREGKRQIGRPRTRRGYNVRMDLSKVS